MGHLRPVDQRRAAQPALGRPLPGKAVQQAAAGPPGERRPATHSRRVPVRLSG